MNICFVKLYTYSNLLITRQNVTDIESNHNVQYSHCLSFESVMHMCETCHGHISWDVYCKQRQICESNDKRHYQHGDLRMDGDSGKHGGVRISVPAITSGSESGSACSKVACGNSVLGKSVFSSSVVSNNASTTNVYGRGMSFVIDDGGPLDSAQINDNDPFPFKYESYPYHHKYLDSSVLNQGKKSWNYHNTKYVLKNEKAHKTFSQKRKQNTQRINEIETFYNYNNNNSNKNGKNYSNEKNSNGKIIITPIMAITTVAIKIVIMIVIIVVKIQMCLMDQII